MGYKIWIGRVGERAVIGARNIDAHNGVREEQVYGSQLPYRVVARRADGALIVETPTAAKTFGHEVVDYFGRRPPTEWRTGK